MVEAVIKGGVNDPSDEGGAIKQIPFTNDVADGFDYSNNLEFKDGKLAVGKAGADPDFEADFNGSFGRGTTEYNSSVGATYTLLATDHRLIINCTTAAVTVDLPSSPSNNRELIIIKNDSSANTVTVDAQAGKTINGSQTFVLTDQYDSVSLSYVANDSAWYIN